MSELSELTLKVTPRDKTGRNASNNLRNSGRIPAVLYGKELNKSFSVAIRKQECSCEKPQELPPF